MKTGRITILGPSGGGKGTQAKLLEEKFGWKHISVGSLFRRHIEEETEIEDFAPDASLAEDSSTDSELSEFKGVPNAGPILGVAPQDQQGTVVERGAPRPFPRETRLASPAGLSYLTVEITLLTLSLFSALAAFIIRRKQNTLR